MDLGEALLERLETGRLGRRRLGSCQGVEQGASAFPFVDLEGSIEILRVLPGQPGLQEAAGEPGVVVGPGGEQAHLTRRASLEVAQRLDGFEGRPGIGDRSLARPGDPTRTHALAPGIGHSPGVLGFMGESERFLGCLASPPRILLR